MRFSVKVFGLVAISSAMISVQSRESVAQDLYAGCTCVSAPISYSGGLGQIVASKGEVLVNNAGASSGQILTGPSEIMVGAGSVAYTVGATCSSSAGANTLISITQPTGPNGNLCVSSLPIETGVSRLSPPVNPTAGLITIGVGVVGKNITPFGSDGKGRPPASP